MKRGLAHSLVVALAAVAVLAGAGSASAQTRSRVSMSDDGAASLTAFGMAADSLAVQAQAAVVSQEPAGWTAALSRLKAGEPIAVHIRNDDSVVGSFVRASSSSLTMRVRETVREIPAGTVEDVIVQRGRNRLRRGLWFGLPVGVLLGSQPCYRVTDTQASCLPVLAAGAAAGGAIGGWIGSRKWRPEVVYTAERPAPAVETPRAAPATVDRGEAPQASALASVLQPFDRIKVRTSAGQTLEGRVSRVSGTTLTIDVKGRAQEIRATDVQEVRRQLGTRAAQGAWVGFLAGAVILDSVMLASSTGRSDDDGSVGAWLVLGTIAGGGGGALWGAAIGAFKHREEVVYRSTGPAVRLHPLLTPQQKGVMVSLAF